MNGSTNRVLSRHAISVLMPVMLALGACATAPYESPSHHRTAPDLAGTRWQVASIDGRNILHGTELTADFGVDGRVNGESGCNRYSGPFIQSGSTVNFGELLSTRRACAEANRQRQEDRMLKVMHGATTVAVVRNQLRLRGPSGSMSFVPATLADANAGPTVVKPRRVTYECQGIEITVQYEHDAVRLNWPDGSDVLALQRSDDGDADVVDYKSAHSEWRMGRDLLWGRQGVPPRSCREK